MSTYTVQPNQSLSDVAVLKYGNVTGVVWLVLDNPILNGPTDRIYEGQQLLIREDIINNRAKRYLEGFPVIATIAGEDLPEGVGFWLFDEYTIQ